MEGGLIRADNVRAALLFVARGEAAAGVVYQGPVIHGPNCRMSNILDSEGNGIILHELARAKKKRKR